MKRILITGSRYWDDYGIIGKALAVQVAPGRVHDCVIVHGGCSTGADAIADWFAEAVGIQREVHPAEWNRYGRSAGPIRNQEMVDLGADICLAFISECTSSRCGTEGRHPSHGASLTAKLAEQAGILTWRYVR